MAKVTVTVKGVGLRRPVSLPPIPRGFSGVMKPTMYWNGVPSCDSDCRETDGVYIRLTPVEPGFDGAGLYNVVRSLLDACEHVTTIIEVVVSNRRIARAIGVKPGATVGFKWDGKAPDYELFMLLLNEYYTPDS